MIRFFIALTVLTGIVAGAVLYGVQQSWFEKPTFFPITLGFLVFGTALIYVYLYRANTTGYFVQIYLVTMVMKLLAYCGYNLLIILKDRSSAVGNVVFFMITYFLFTALEIAFLYGKISGENSAQNRS